MFLLLTLSQSKYFMVVSGEVMVGQYVKEWPCCFACLQLKVGNTDFSALLVSS
jgi:hypothetical protein